MFPLESHRSVGQFPYESAIIIDFSGAALSRQSLKRNERILLLVNLMSNFATAMRRRLLTLLFVVIGSALGAPAVLAQPREGGEAALKLPDLSSVTFMGIDGHKLLLVGLVFCF